jgi:hypothetical protein
MQAPARRWCCSASCRRRRGRRGRRTACCPWWWRWSSSATRCSSSAGALSICRPLSHLQHLGAGLLLPLAAPASAVGRRMCAPTPHRCAPAAAPASARKQCEAVAAKLAKTLPALLPPLPEADAAARSQLVVALQDAQGGHQNEQLESMMGVWRPAPCVAACAARCERVGCDQAWGGRWLCLAAAWLPGWCP